eukprot:TRINITY_DN14162_c0_g1_i1.p1 TRINITY_DN14162_c0_g1~~TRINITY_DN14162_c0_g1_i1.p1  ORF type:complete len:790 (-),score=240.69 TRINITY_DN14162_c0_g1_i1:134-2503(-)
MCIRDRVYKEECVYSCARCTSEHGLFVGLESFLGVGDAWLAHHRSRAHEDVFLNITRRRKAPEEKEDADVPAAKSVADAISQITKEARVDYDEKLTLVLFGEDAQRTLISLDDNPLLPGKVQKSIDSVMKANDVGRQDDLKDWQPDLKESRYARELEQVATEGKVASCNPADWKCGKTGATMGKGENQTESLWLNLSDGFIGGGRRNWDGTGGNNSALEHYEDMKSLGKEYPLSVKLGTITADGDGAVGDVFSYAADEGDMVIDPLLKEHLAHWGIDAAALDKTEKTIAEMELDFNYQFEWGRVLEDGKELEPAYGPGLTGLINMGNTCYMNSILQLLFSIEPFIATYGTNLDLVTASTSPHTDLRCQLNKIAHGMLSGNHSAVQPPFGMPDEVGIRPKLFKMLAAGSSEEFKSGSQQDAVDYLYHLLTQIERAEKGAGSGVNLDGAFEFVMQDRLECNQTKKVKYNTNMQDRRKTFDLKIPMHLCKNQAEYETYSAKCDEIKKQGGKCEDEPVVRRVEFQDALEFNMQDADLPDAGKGGLTKRTRFGTFPPYLLLQVMRYEFDMSTMTSHKLEVDLPMPDNLDLNPYRGTGLQEGEVEMDEDVTVTPAPACNPATVAQLVEMGFPESACKKAVIETGNNGAEAAMAWVMEHMEDAAFPFADEPAAAPAAGGVDEGAVSMLMAMGFERPKCLKALQQTGGDQERAVDWIFSHPDDSGADEAPATVQPNDGDGKYELVGFVSHVGRNTSCGHYVAHIKKDGKWIFFNDEKVVHSQDPPRDCGYLYLYKQL